MPVISEKTQNDVVLALASGSASMEIAAVVIKAAEAKLNEQEKRIKDLEDADKRLRSALSNTASWLRHEAGKQLDDEGHYRGAFEQGVFDANHKAADEIEKVLA